MRAITAWRRRNRRVHLALLILGALGLIGGLWGFAAKSATPATAQSDRYLYWERFDVTIDQMDTSTNRFRVTEDYRLTVERGPFRYGFAEIPTGRLDAIEEVQIYQDNLPFTQACSDLPGTYCVTQSGDSLSVRYYFRAPLTDNSTAHITLVYRVRGALRAYEEGDELFWVALPPDLSFPVHWSRVTVQLPDGVEPLAATSYPDTWTQQISGNVITWDSPEWPSRQGQAEVRVKYPHNPAMPPGSWQAAYDREQAYIDKWQPLVSLLVLALSALVGIGGVLAVVITYQRRGRDPEPLTVPEYISTPPNDEAPGIVGALVDEKVDMQDIMATLVDLARRGYVVFEQTGRSGLKGLLGGTDFVFHRTDKAARALPAGTGFPQWVNSVFRALGAAPPAPPPAVPLPDADEVQPPDGADAQAEKKDKADEPADQLRHYEYLLLHAIFGGRKRVSLKDLRNKFYRRIPAIRKAMYQELVRADYFRVSPETIRTRWLAFSFVGVFLGVIGAIFCISSSTLLLISPLLALLPVSVALVSLVALFFSWFMPAKTMKGSQQAAMWLAFKRYLENLKRYDTEAARERFEEYLPYAIAFGVDKDFLRQVAPMLQKMPSWYFPTYMGGPWGSGYRPGFGHSSGHLGGGLGNLGGGMSSGGGFSMSGGLEGMSSSLTDGLNAMSSGLTDLLNSASRVMTSRPSSSGGGGGFSGGGAGGSSGGGSAGFG